MDLKKRSQCPQVKMDWLHAFYQQAFYSTFFTGNDCYYREIDKGVKRICIKSVLFVCLLKPPPVYQRRILRK